MPLGGITAHPAGEPATRQARNLPISLDRRLDEFRFLVRDRGSNFTSSFDAVFRLPEPRSRAPPFRHRG
jgi:hypothetical protein